MNCMKCQGETDNPKFCSRSCAAKYNNVLFPKRKGGRRICPQCGEPKNFKSNVCFQCRGRNQQARLASMTLAESLNMDGHHRSRYNTVRHHARQWAKKNLPPFCQICRYSKMFQVCHVRDISSFPLDTLVSVINDASNIVILCPNHHWEFDHDLL